MQRAVRHLKETSPLPLPAPPQETPAILPKPLHSGIWEGVPRKVQATTNGDILEEESLRAGSRRAQEGGKVTKSSRKNVILAARAM